jgi:hypothetical protein
LAWTAVNWLRSVVLLVCRLLTSFCRPVLAFCSALTSPCSVESVDSKEAIFACTAAISPPMPLPLSSCPGYLSLSSSARPGTGAKATKRPAAIKGPKRVEHVIRPRLLPFRVRQLRLISFAVAVPPMSVLLATSLVARQSSFRLHVASNRKEADFVSVQERFVAFEPLQNFPEAPGQRIAFG